MDRQDIEQLYRAVDNRLYDFYRNFLYHLGDHPALFWTLLLLAGGGLFGVFYLLGVLL